MDKPLIADLILLMFIIGLWLSIKVKTWISGLVKVIVFFIILLDIILILK